MYDDLCGERMELAGSKVLKLGMRRGCEVLVGSQVTVLEMSDAVEFGVGPFKYPPSALALAVLQRHASNAMQSDFGGRCREESGYQSG